PRVVLVRRADVAQAVQPGGEEIEELLQADEVLDDADGVELQLVHALRELRPEPAFVVENAEGTGTGDAIAFRWRPNGHPIVSLNAIKARPRFIDLLSMRGSM